MLVNNINSDLTAQICRRSKSTLAANAARSFSILKGSCFLYY